ncbi:MAG TPA: DUF504 domain-containing protein [Gammaproteobacteria bacterium]|nr:DUF504 domain-containing protein [Gammaproteobacteria bacterium]
MIPIQELLNRIRWDPAFGAADFTIGYYDRVEERILRVPLSRLWVEPGDHFAFQLMDAEGEQHSVPLHRIREVYRNGELIWHRDG